MNNYHQSIFPGLEPKVHLLQPGNFNIVMCGYDTLDIDLATTQVDKVTCKECLFRSNVDNAIDQSRDELKKIE